MVESKPKLRGRKRRAELVSPTAEQRVVDEFPSFPLPPASDLTPVADSQVDDLLTMNARLNAVISKWRDPDMGEDPLAEMDWRDAVLAKAKENDIEGMVTAAAPHAQYNIIKTALKDDDPELRFKASVFILEQAGKGAIKKVESTQRYEEMPDDQLAAMIRSKLSRIRTLNPAFDLSKLLPAAGAVDADFETIPGEDETFEPDSETLAPEASE